jgi:Uma2 family endonuclease
VPGGETRVAVRGVPWSVYELWVDVADYPNPDLAIEVDISPSLVDRPGIHAFLVVAEVWRFDGQTLTIERLDPGGRYLSIETSAWLPIKNSEVVRWLTQEDTTDESAWARRLRN